MRRLLRVLPLLLAACGGGDGPHTRGDAATSEPPDAALIRPTPPGYPDAPVVAYDCTGDIDDLQRDIFLVGCAYAACHGQPDPAEGLDLEAPGVAARLVGVEGAHCGVPLVVPGDPDGSLLIDKLENYIPGCGIRMPPPDFIPPRPRHEFLGPNHIACLRSWIESLR